MDYSSDWTAGMMNLEPQRLTDHDEDEDDEGIPLDQIRGSDCGWSSSDWLGFDMHDIDFSHTPRSILAKRAYDGATFSDSKRHQTLRMFQALPSTGYTAYKLPS